jgi:membrane-bound lytic murein transglycosylase A
MPPRAASQVFANLPGWVDDDHTAALAAFRISLPSIVTTSSSLPVWPRATALAMQAQLDAIAPGDSAAARAFFETYFTPDIAAFSQPAGFFTAYYEPIIRAARTPSTAFSVPLHRRPADLINLVREADRATPVTGPIKGLTHARATSSGPAPYATRRAIDEGSLNGHNLELFYLADVVDRFFLQVQGSGVLAFDDGSTVRVGYDGKNGHPYTSLGRLLVDAGTTTTAEMSLDFLAKWLRADPVRGQQTIWRNESYVFFRTLPDATAPEGVLGKPLSPLRSLAVDPAHIALGLPVFLVAPTISHLTGAPFRHLLVAQDVGSAIIGPSRGDIFVGTGGEAGRRAGITKHPGCLVALRPRDDEATA